MSSVTQKSFGVAAYSFPCWCGFARRPDASPIAEPLNAAGIIDLATEYNLRGIEIPLAPMLPDLSPATLDRLRDTLAERNLTLLVDTGIVDVATLEEVLPLAKRAGATVVRAVLSSILEGARGTAPGGWDAYLAEMRSRVVALRPTLEKLDMVLALEDHQDVNSDDLIMLCEAGGPQVGVALDAANPLAVGEEPLEFARKVGPYIRDVHIKDYSVYATASGYRLVRTAIGEGEIPWRELLTLLREVAPDAPQHIELAALYARHIRLFEDQWWETFPPRDVRDVLSTFRFLARNAHLDSEPWQTPWEAGASVDEVAAWERAQFERSVAFLTPLIAEL